MAGIRGTWLHGSQSSVWRKASLVLAEEYTALLSGTLHPSSLALREALPDGYAMRPQLGSPWLS